MTGNVIQQKSFDFALSIVALYCKLRDQHEYVISRQLLKSGTSIGAKEARQAKCWLRLLQESDLTNVDELIRILTSIVKTTEQNPQQLKKAE